MVPLTTFVRRPTSHLLLSLTVYIPLSKCKFSFVVSIQFFICTSPTLHLVCSQEFCTSFVFCFSGDNCKTQEKPKTKVTQSFGGQTGCIMGDVQMAVFRSIKSVYLGDHPLNSRSHAFRFIKYWYNQEKFDADYPSFPLLDKHITLFQVSFHY